MKIKGFRVMCACLLAFTASCAPKTGPGDAAKEPGSGQGNMATQTESPGSKATISEAHS